VAVALGLDERHIVVCCRVRRCCGGILGDALIDPMAGRALVDALIICPLVNAVTVRTLVDTMTGRALVLAEVQPLVAMAVAVAFVFAEVQPWPVVWSSPPIAA